MYEVLLILFLIVAVALVALIMLQQGRGADIGASSGSSISGTLLGSSGSANFMTRITASLAALFFIISLVLGNINSNKTNGGRESKDLILPEKNESSQPTMLSEPTRDIPR